MFGEMPITQLHYHYENWTAKTKHFSAGLIDGIMQKLGRGENVNMYKDGICVQHTLHRHLQYISNISQYEKHENIFVYEVDCLSRQYNVS